LYYVSIVTVFQYYADYVKDNEVFQVCYIF
jgi:hypothetical protein